CRGRLHRARRVEAAPQSGAQSPGERSALTGYRLEWARGRAFQLFLPAYKGRPLPIARVDRRNGELSARRVVKSNVTGFSGWEGNCRIGFDAPSAPATGPGVPPRRGSSFRRAFRCLLDWRWKDPAR